MLIQITGAAIDSKSAPQLACQTIRCKEEESLSKRNYSNILT